MHANPGLIVFAVAVKLVEFVVVLPIFAFMFVSYTNGKVVPNGKTPFLPSMNLLDTRHVLH